MAENLLEILAFAAGQSPVPGFLKRLTGVAFEPSAERSGLLAFEEECDPRRSGEFKFNRRRIGTDSRSGRTKMKRKCAWPPSQVNHSVIVSSAQL